MPDEDEADDAGDAPDRMDLHAFRASRRRKTDNLLKEDHRDVKRFFALDSAAYRDMTAQGGLDEKTKELLGLVASTVLRCNDCIAYHCDQCVKVGWKKSELLDALNVALVIGGSITIPHIRTVWEVVEQLYEEREAQTKAKAGSPRMQAAANEVVRAIEEHDSEAKIMLGLPPEAKSRKERMPKKAETAPASQGTPPQSPASQHHKAPHATGSASEPRPAASPSASAAPPGEKKPAPPTVKPEGKSPKKSQGI